MSPLWEGTRWEVVPHENATEDAPDKWAYWVRGKYRTGAFPFAVFGRERAIRYAKALDASDQATDAPDRR